MSNDPLAMPRVHRGGGDITNDKLTEHGRSELWSGLGTLVRLARHTGQVDYTSRSDADGRRWFYVETPVAANPPDLTDVDRLALAVLANRPAKDVASALIDAMIETGALDAGAAAEIAERARAEGVREERARVVMLCNERCEAARNAILSGSLDAMSRRNAYREVADMIGTPLTPASTT